jgi:hypothetical protein
MVTIVKKTLVGGTTTVVGGSGSATVVGGSGSATSARKAEILT